MRPRAHPRLLLTALLSAGALGLGLRAQAGVLPATPDAGLGGRDAGADDAELANNYELLRDLDLLEDLDMVAPAPDGGSDEP